MGQERIQWRSIIPAVAVVVVLLATLFLVPPRRGGAPGADGSNVTLAPGRALDDDADAATVIAAEPDAVAGQDPLAAEIAGGAAGPGTPVSSAPQGPGSPGGVPHAPAHGGGQAAAATYPGITAEEILVGWAYQQEGCGGYDANAILTAMGINSDVGALARKAVELFNEHPVEALELTPEQARYLGGAPGYYGRMAKLQLYDDKGPACEDAGRAMAVKAAEQDGIFAMVQDGTKGTEGWVSEEIAARQRIHIGNGNGTELYYSQRGGHAWDARWGQGDKAAAATASWMCRDLAGKPASDTGDPLIAGQPRVFGMLRFDSPNDEYVANAVKAELAKCGIAFTLDIAVSTDLAVQQQQTQTAMVRMRNERVTSIVTNIDWTNMATATQVASKQRFFPEWLVSSYYQNDWGSRVYYFYDEPHKRNVMGTTFIYSEHELQHDQTYEHRMWKLAYPDRDQPETGWREVVYQMRLLFRGIYGAGPDLTPASWVQGLGVFCDPCPRRDPLLPLEILRPGHHSNWADFGIIRWDPDRQDVTEVDGVQGGYRVGWWGFFDDGRRYLGTVSRPSTYRSP